MNIYQGHEFVDLGLPSGTLWATCNVGANKPEDYGDYLSWDEGKTVDAKWGNGWQMPSKEQWEELVQKTKTICTTRNGVYGRLLTALNGNSLFLPAAGYRRGSLLIYAGSNGCYWSSSLFAGGPDYARYFYWYFYFPSGYTTADSSGSSRGIGRSVRAVRVN